MSVRTTASRSARVATVLAVAAAGVVATATGSSAAAVSITASPATGAATSVITLSTTTANTFKTAGGALRVPATSGVPNTSAVQFTVNACPTAAPTGTARTVTDGVTNSTATLTSASAAFTSADLGRLVTGAGIPNNTTILQVNSGTSVTLSAAATATASSVSITITPYLVPVARQVTDGVTTNTSTTITSATAVFTAGDVGKLVTSTNIPANTYIASVTNATTAVLTAAATASGTGATFVIAPQTASQFTVVTGTKAIIKPAVGSPANAYKICIYDNGVGTAVTSLVTSAYQVYAAPTIVTPLNTVSGPAVGGNTLVVDGTGFSSKTTATLGGIAMTNFKLISSTQFSATVPAHAPSSTPVDLVVTSDGGPVTAAASYTYLDGISVQPQFVTSGQAAVLDITGAGFAGSNMNFANSGTANDTTSHVFLKKGGQAATWTGGTDNAECGNVTVISDAELICTLDTTAAGGTAGAVPIPVASYQVLIVDKGDGSGTSPRLTQVASGSALTVAAF